MQFFSVGLLSKDRIVRDLSVWNSDICDLRILFFLAIVGEFSFCYSKHFRSFTFCFENSIFEKCSLNASYLYFCVNIMKFAGWGRGVKLRHIHHNVDIYWFREKFSFIYFFLCYLTSTFVNPFETKSRRDQRL